jgi:Glycosyl transferase family 90
MWYYILFLFISITTLRLLHNAKCVVSASSLSIGSIISSDFVNLIIHGDQSSRKLTTSTYYARSYTHLKNVVTDMSLEKFLAILINERHQQQIVLFLWDSSGNLIDHTPIMEHARWLRDELISTSFNRTGPSEYGKVAILFNTDVVKKLEMPAIPRIPPVPLLLYTKPDSRDDIPTMITIPTAYELNNLVQKQMNKIQNGLLESFILTEEIFNSRQSKLVWRGSYHPNDNSRTILLELGQNVSNHDWLDATTGEIYNSEYVPTYMIENFKYHIDIGGVSGTSWCGLRWKMCSGGLVFKVDTWSKDLWHESIEPWKHYIPVQDDLNDIYEKHNWAEENRKKAYKIASEGQKKCLESYSTQHSQNLLTNIIHNLQPSSKETIDQAQTYLKSEFL